MMDDDDRKNESDSDNEDELFGKQRGPSRIGSRKRWLILLIINSTLKN